LLKFECRACGIFEKKYNGQVEGIIPDTADCPSCHRLAEFKEGVVMRVHERKRVVAKTQKKISQEDYNE
jgi:hypothetical protein